MRILSVLRYSLYYIVYYDSLFGKMATQMLSKLWEARRHATVVGNISNCSNDAREFGIGVTRMVSPEVMSTMPAYNAFPVHSFTVYGVMWSYKTTNSYSVVRTYVHVSRCTETLQSGIYV